MALLEDQFLESVPPCLDTILIPADVTPDGVITEIIDYSRIFKFLQYFSYFIFFSEDTG